MKYGMMNGKDNTEDGWIVKIHGPGKTKGTLKVTDEVSHGPNHSFDIPEKSVIEISKEEYEEIEEMLFKDEVPDRYFDMIEEIAQR